MQDRDVISASGWMVGTLDNGSLKLEAPLAFEMIEIDGHYICNPIKANDGKHWYLNFVLKGPDGKFYHMYGTVDTEDEAVALIQKEILKRKERQCVT